jgi:anti-sigma regulatory factor (Ser/Thr protein kinase)
MAEERFSLEPDIAEIPRLVAWVERCCGAAGLDSGAAFHLALALDEAVTNVISYAFVGEAPPHRVEVRLEIAAETVTATVVDNGRSFDPSAPPAPHVSAPLEERTPGGLGNLLMHRMVDRVEYRRSGSQNHLRLEKSRS